MVLYNSIKKENLRAIPLLRIEIISGVRLLSRVPKNRRCVSDVVAVTSLKVAFGFASAADTVLAGMQQISQRMKRKSFNFRDMSRYENSQRAGRSIVVDKVFMGYRLKAAGWG